MLLKFPGWFPNPCSVSELLTNFLDLTSPPSRQLLRVMAERCEDAKDRDAVRMLSTLIKVHGPFPLSPHSILVRSHQSTKTE